MWNRESDVRRSAAARMNCHWKMAVQSTTAFLLGMLVLLPLPAAAQSYPDVSDVIGGEAQQKLEERLRHSLQRENEQRDKIGRRAAELIGREGKKRTITIGGRNFPESPAKHPLLDNDGADPSGKSKDEYTTKDTEALFHEATAAQCIEDRQVFNADYLSACSKICDGPWVRVQPGCPRCVPGQDLNCVRNEYYVSELYFPVYETRTYTGRAMGSFDPNGGYLSGEDKRPDLGLQAAKQRLHSTGKQLAEDAVRTYTGKDPSAVSDKLYPDWYTPEVEWYGHDGSQPNNPAAPYSFHTLTYQTNAHRQAARRRPQPQHHGYELESNCFFHTLDNPAKDVIAGASYGNEQFLRAAMTAHETRSIDARGARAVLPKSGPNMFELAARLQPGDALPDEIQGLAPSQRMSRWQWMRKGLRRIGVRNGAHDKDYIFYGFSLTPYNTSRENAFVDPFYAALSHGFSHYMLTSMEEFAGNKPQRRALRYSYYTPRGGRQNYSGEDPVLKEEIAFTDKIQIIFPPWNDSGKRQGSHCFRPETVARIEPGMKEGDLSRRRAGRSTSSNHFNIPLEIRKRFPEKGDLKDGLAYANEVRIAYYIKRVNCYCTKCGKPAGCMVLNDGDHKEDNFYGETPLANSAPVLYLGGTTMQSGRTGRRAQQPRDLYDRRGQSSVQSGRAAEQRNSGNHRF